MAMIATPLLDRIRSPRDLAGLTFAELSALASEIRAFLTDTVSHTGGHLASNLGVVELTIALHRVFDFSRDRLVFDVGHQCYAHKLLTGRKQRFHTLRQKDGITGFPNPGESQYDAFVVGHASTSISSAVGLAAAWRLQGDARKAVALVGDGAIGGGMCFEAMNHAGHAREDVLVVLNDNDMAIAETVGAFSTYLTDLRSSPVTRRLRDDLRRCLENIPVIGPSLQWTQEHVLDAIKSLIEPGQVFSAMGFAYFGPIDGHDIAGLEHELQNLRDMRGPRLLHAVTRKGQGFLPASADPETYHSAVPFEIRGSDQVAPRTVEPGETWSGILVDRLIERARSDRRIVAITAAMPAGTGIKTFAREFTDRFIDVGICEAHSVTFAAGLARAGLKPVLGIYSTFLQRGYDQIVHDLAAQGDLGLVLALDRAGLVGADGPTHHGVFDIAFLRHVPNLVLLAPASAEEMRGMLDFALAQDRPVVIRYPRGGPKDSPFESIATCAPVELGRSQVLRPGSQGAVFAYGRMVGPAMAAADKAAESGLDLAVVNARFAKPLDREAILAAAREHGLLFTVEDHVLAGGFGSAVAELLADSGASCRLVRLGIPDRFIEHGSVAQLDSLLGLDAPGLCASFLRAAGRPQQLGAAGL